MNKLHSGTSNMFQNNALTFVSELPLRNLHTSMCHFAPCDRIVHWKGLLKTFRNREKNISANKWSQMPCKNTI